MFLKNYYLSQYLSSCCVCVYRFDSEFSSGATYKIQKFKATLIVFNSGSISVTGTEITYFVFFLKRYKIKIKKTCISHLLAPSEALLKQSIEHIYPLLLQFAPDGRRTEIITQQQNNVQGPNALELFKSPEVSSLTHSRTVGESSKNGQLDLDSFV